VTSVQGHTTIISEPPNVRPRRRRFVRRPRGLGAALRQSRPGGRWTRLPGQSCNGRAMTGADVIGIRVPTAVGLHQFYSWECRNDHRLNGPPPPAPHAPGIPASGEHDDAQHNQLEWHGHLLAPRTLPTRLDPLVAPWSRFGCSLAAGLMAAISAQPAAQTGPACARPSSMRSATTSASTDARLHELRS